MLKRNYNLLFVYDDLKTGYYNNILLKTSKFIANASTYKKFLLVEKGIPFLIEDEDTKGCSYINGEIYEISNEILKRIDIMKGHPSFFRRKPIWVKTNKEIYVFAYIMDKNNINNYNIIKEGNWERSYY